MVSWQQIVPEVLRVLRNPGHWTDFKRRFLDVSPPLLAAVEHTLEAVSRDRHLLDDPTVRSSVVNQISYLLSDGEDGEFGLQSMEAPLTDARFAGLRVDVGVRVFSEHWPRLSNEDRLFLCRRLGNSYAQRLGRSRTDDQLAARRWYCLGLELCPAGDPESEWLLRNGLGTVIKEHSGTAWAARHDEAIREYELARDCLLRAARQPGSDPRTFRHHQAAVLMNIANARRDRVFWDVQDREEALREVLGRYDQIVSMLYDAPYDLAAAYLNRGIVWFSLASADDPSAIERAIDSWTNALELYRRCAAPVWEALTLLNLGIGFARLRGRTETAREYLAEAIAKYQQLGIRRERIPAHDQLGQLFIETDRLPNALEEYTAAIDLISEELRERTSDHARSTWLSQSVAVIERGLLCCSRLAESSSCDDILRTRACECAVKWSELTRARNLERRLALRKHSVASPLTANDFARHEYEFVLRTIDERLGAIHRRHEAAAIGTARGFRIAGDGDTRASDQRTVDKLLGYRQTILQQIEGIESATTEFDQCSLTASLDGSVMCETARRCRSTLLTLRTLHTGTLAIAATRAGRVDLRLVESLTTVSLAEGVIHGGADLEVSWTRAFSDFRETGDLSRLADDLDEFCWWLGRRLFAPLASWLQDLDGDSTDPPALIILAGPGLNILPLHAACWEEEGVEQILCDRYEISYAPSLSVLRQVIEADSHPPERSLNVLTVGNPRGDLISAEREVEQVADVFHTSTRLGNGRDRISRATRDQTLTEISRHDVLHFATHCHFNDFAPWTGSRIQLATSRTGEAEALSPSDFERCDLSHNWLTVLSSCESGVSDYADLTGEQLGFATALLAAGCRSVLSTLWPVDDESTALLCGRFYQELIDRDTGRPRMTRREALRRAQKWLRSLPLEFVRGLPGRPAGAPRDFRSVYFWAAFQLHGAP